MVLRHGKLQGIITRKDILYHIGTKLDTLRARVNEKFSASQLVLGPDRLNFFISNLPLLATLSKFRTQATNQSMPTIYHFHCTYPVTYNCKENYSFQERITTHILLYSDLSICTSLDFLQRQSSFSKRTFFFVTWTFLEWTIFQLKNYRTFHKTTRTLKKISSRRRSERAK